MKRTRVFALVLAALLLVPAVVDAKTSYKDAWTRSQQQIRKMIPMAAELKVIIAVEEVWNKFLLSPLEFASYVDSFKSPWVKAYFDVGNVVIHGYPQDWIRTLGSRLRATRITSSRNSRGKGLGMVNILPAAPLGTTDQMSPTHAAVPPDHPKTPPELVL